MLEIEQVLRTLLNNYSITDLEVTKPSLDESFTLLTEQARRLQGIRPPKHSDCLNTTPSKRYAAVTHLKENIMLRYALYDIRASILSTDRFFFGVHCPSSSSCSSARCRTTPPSRWATAT